MQIWIDCINSRILWSNCVCWKCVVWLNLCCNKLRNGNIFNLHSSRLEVIYNLKRWTDCCWFYTYLHLQNSSIYPVWEFAIFRTRWYVVKCFSTLSLYLIWRVFYVYHHCLRIRWPKLCLSIWISYRVQ